MNTKLKLKLFGVTITRAMAVRMAADAAMIAFSLLMAITLRFFYDVVVKSSDSIFSSQHEFFSYMNIYGQNVGILVGLGLVTFGFNGFYTYGKSYQGRYKVLVISNAVILCYLSFAFLTYILLDHIGIQTMPRGAFLMAFVINLALCVSSRTWTFLWEQIIRPEKEARLLDGDRPARNVLVIGGAGYIGSALIPKLLEKGCKVRILDLFLFGMEPIADYKDHPRLELVEGDFRHVDKIVQVMKGMDSVVHLGAIVGDPACDIDHNLTVDVNLSATQMVAQVAKASGIRRFIFASTCSVYGACDDLLDERSEVEPISLYGHTKLAAERGLFSMADQYFRPTILRFSTIYGLSGRTRFDLVVNLLSAKAKIESIITVHGGDQWRPFLHVDDAALAVDCCLEAPLSSVGNEIFNVGCDEQNKTIEQIGELIHEQVFTAELQLDKGTTDKRNYRVSFTKIRNTLGYEPRWTLEEGVQQVVEAIASGEVEDYLDPKYSNVKFFRDNGAIEIISADDGWTHILHEKSSTQELAKN